MSYAFGNHLELDTESRELRRDGQLRCMLTEQQCNVLVHLMKRHGHIVSTQELVEQFFAGPYIDTSAVRGCVMEIRKCIDDDATRESLIQTMRGQGYRFVGHAETRGDDAPVLDIPYLRNVHFAGRDLLLDTLRTGFMSGDPTGLRQVLHGLGGVGKTQVAVEYAYRYAASYTTVCWVRAEMPTTLATDYAGLAKQLRLSERTICEQAAVVQAVRHWLEQNSCWLLIFDNASARQVVEAYLPRNPTGHVLITSSDPNWGSVAQVVSVSVFERADAVTFLRKRTSQRDDTSAAALADALGDLPLALAQAVAYIEATGMTLAGYLELFQTRHRELWEVEKPPPDYPHTIATTWSLAMEETRQQPLPSADLLSLCAYLGPDDLPLTLLRQGVEHLPVPLAATVTNPVTLTSAIAVLRRYALIELTGDARDALSMHRLVQAVVRDRLQEQGEDWAWIDTALRVVLSALARARQSGKVGMQAMMQKAHLKNWHIIEIHKKDAQVAHHLIIDERAVGQELWQKMVTAMEQHFFATDQHGKNNGRQKSLPLRTDGLF